MATKKPASKPRKTKLTGNKRPKSAEHKAAISAGLKAYHARKKTAKAVGKKTKTPAKALTKRQQDINTQRTKQADKARAERRAEFLANKKSPANASLDKALKSRGLKTAKSGLVTKVDKAAPRPAIAPGASVKRNVSIYQLRGIIDKAKAGDYGKNSKTILKRSEAELKQHLKAKKR